MFPAGFVGNGVRRIDARVDLGRGIAFVDDARMTVKDGKALVDVQRVRPFGRLELVHVGVAEHAFAFACFSAAAYGDARYADEVVVLASVGLVGGVYGFVEVGNSPVRDGNAFVRFLWGVFPVGRFGDGDVFVAFFRLLRSSHALSSTRHQAQTRLFPVIRRGG